MKSKKRAVVKRKAFSNYLKMSRERALLSQHEVARALGYATPQFISNLERGLSCPPIKALRILSRLYKIDMDEVFEAVLAISIFNTKRTLVEEYERIKKGK